MYNGCFLLKNFSSVGKRSAKWGKKEKQLFTWGIETFTRKTAKTQLHNNNCIACLSVSNSA